MSLGRTRGPGPAGPARGDGKLIRWSLRRAAATAGRPRERARSPSTTPGAASNPPVRTAGRKLPQPPEAARSQAAASALRAAPPPAARAPHRWACDAAGVQGRRCPRGAGGRTSRAEEKQPGGVRGKLESAGRWARPGSGRPRVAGPLGARPPGPQTPRAEPKGRGAPTRLKPKIPGDARK